MNVALIPCGLSEWRQQGRMLGRVEVALTEGGERGCLAWCTRLAPLNLGRILHGPDDLSKSTARLIGRRLDVPAKALDSLIEVDVGVWAGLTRDELKKRYASAYRELCDAPLNVSPPGGEEFSEAARRLEKCLRRQLRRNNAGAIGFVLRPLALGLMYGILSNENTDTVWQMTQGTNEPVILENIGAPALAGQRRGE
jgi:broad specificity phosphatase PhoE